MVESGKRNSKGKKRNHDVLVLALCLVLYVHKFKCALCPLCRQNMAASDRRVPQTQGMSFTSWFTRSKGVGWNLNSDLANAKPLAFLLFHQNGLTCLYQAELNTFGVGRKHLVAKRREEMPNLLAAL